MTFENDKEIIISVAGSRRAMVWKPQKMMWSDFINRISQVVVSTETLQEYKTMSKAQQGELKDVGGFVGGTLKGNRRKSGCLIERYLITLDADSIAAGGTEDVIRRVSGLGCACLIYSTRKHESAVPRLRIVVPTDRAMTAEEYEPAARKLAALIGIGMFDPTTFDPVRMMYFASMCSGAERVFCYEDKPFLSVDGVLATYTDWRNAAEWPEVPGTQGKIQQGIKRLGDPREKPDVIGAFCRVYDIPAVIDKFLPDIYTDNGNGRYTYAAGSTAAGAVLYDEGKYLYSNHGTDPARGRSCNSFDLVRIHKFGYLDEEAAADTPVNRLPSYKAMREMALQDGAVSKQYLQDMFGAPVDEDLKPFHKIRNGVPCGIYDEAIVRDIVAKRDFFIMGNTFFIYSGGVYQEDRGGLTVKGWIKAHMYPQFTTARAVNSVYQLLSYQKERQKQYSELNNYPDTWINFKNGMFDALGWKMYPHSPEYLSINQVPHNFSMEQPESTGAVDKFLNEAIGSKDDISMLYQYVGYCFTKDISLEKFMILNGIGGTGKSVLISLIVEAVGQCNTSSISLQKLNERFYAIELMGKLLNACADIPGDAMKSVDIIKQLVSGDLMMGERKGQDPINFWNVAKLLFSGNTLPLNLDEATDAFYRRLLILKMDTKPANADPNMEEKLLKDIDYFIYKAVQAVQFSFMLGGITESRRSREEVMKLYKYSDTVQAFLDDCTVSCMGAKVERSALYVAYQFYCGENDRTALTRNAFYRNLTESKKICHRRDSNGRYFSNIKLIL